MATIRFPDGVMHTGHFDTDLYPIPPKLIEPSDTECVHTPQPDGYNEWHEWARMASKTHAQISCPRCGRLRIWLPKAAAKEINKRQRAEQREFNKRFQKDFDARLKHSRETGEYLTPDSSEETQ